MKLLVYQMWCVQYENAQGIWIIVCDDLIKANAVVDQKEHAGYKVTLWEL